MPNEDREALRSAAESAVRLISKYEQTISRCKAKITPLRAIVNAWDAYCGRKPRYTDDDVAPPELQPSPRIRRGEVAAAVAQVLASGESLGEPEIRKRAEILLHVQLQRPTVYSALRRGRDLRQYSQTDQLWHLRAGDEEGPVDISPHSAA